MDRREEIRQLLVRREREGLTFRELAARTGVPAGTLTFWAWKLRKESTGSECGADSGPQFVELVPAAEVERARVEGGGEIEVLLANGRRLLVGEGFDEERLVRVVKALERC